MEFSQFSNPPDRIRAVLACADDIDFTEGLEAYRRYRALFEKLAEAYEVTLPQAVATFVATSPNNDYYGNLRSAVSLLTAHRAGKPLETVTVSTYRAAAARAWRVLNGEDFLSFTVGEKTRSFYLNILEPENPEPVTVDGHMLAIWTGRALSMRRAGKFISQYRHVAAAVREVAAETNLIPNQVQAICWYTWKRIHKPVYHDGQLHLLRADSWNVLLEPGDIQPYPERLRKQVRQLELSLSSQNSLWQTLH